MLRSIVFLGTGASSYIDIASAERRGICVCTIRGYGGRTVAEHAFALLRAAARNVAAMDGDVRAESDGRTAKAAAAAETIGLGGVGSQMARLAAAFGMDVVG